MSQNNAGIKAITGFGAGALATAFAMAGTATDGKVWYVAAAFSAYTSLVAFVGAAGDALDGARQPSRPVSNDLSDRVEIGASSLTQDGSHISYSRQPVKPQERKRIPYTRELASQPRRNTPGYRRPGYTRF